MPTSLRPLALCTALLLGSTSLSAQATFRDHVDPARIQARRDSFVVMLRGNPGGWQVLSAARDGAGWTLGDAVTIDGVVSQSSAIRFDARMNELGLRQEGTMMGKPMRIILDAKNGRMTGSALTPLNPSGELAIDVPSTDGLLDDNAVTPLLAYVRWTDSLTATFPVVASGKGTLSQYTARVLGKESVTVPAGTFDTWRVQLEMTNSRMVANVTTAAPHRIVRISNGPRFEMLLVK